MRQEMNPKIFKEKPDFSKLPGGWDADCLDFDFSALSNEVSISNMIKNPEITRYEDKEHLRTGLNKIVIIDRFLNDKMILTLKNFMHLSPNFEKVGIQGMMDVKDESNVGSLRTTIFSTVLAKELTKRFMKSEVCASLETNEFFPSDTFSSEINRKWVFEGCSPMFRFMKYSKGGQHYTHYDSSYMYNFQDRFTYRTLMSFVIYLESNGSQGGETRFIKDGQFQIPTDQRKHNDWDRQANENEILAKVEPMPGRILIFPHRLAHDVSTFLGDQRIIIRGDLIYKTEL